VERYLEKAKMRDSAFCRLPRMGRSGIGWEDMEKGERHKIGEKHDISACK
jgi:hypothetical protein